MANDMPPEQIRLIEALQAIPIEWNLEEEWQRRNTAVEAIIAYCNYAEGGPLQGRSREGDKQLRPFSWNIKTTSNFLLSHKYSSKALANWLSISLFSQPWQVLLSSRNGAI